MESPSFEELIQAIRSQLPEKVRILVGFSGGLDSSLLLHATAAAFPGSEILAIHCNHQVSPNADDWQEFCKQQAENLGVSFVVEKLGLTGGFTEEKGREARFKAFAKHMQTEHRQIEHRQKSSVLLLGHHADDQVETFLFRLFRGTGLKGLTGIDDRRVFTTGEIIRPLLAFSREQLEKIAIGQNLQWIEDDSNQDESFDRNFIRQALLPKIVERWPTAKRQIHNLVSHLRDDLELLNEYADGLIAQSDLKEHEDQRSLSLEELKKLELKQQRLALRRLLHLETGIQPNAGDIEEICKQVILSSFDAEPCLVFNGLEIRRFKSRLYLMPVSMDKVSCEEEIEWDGLAPLYLEGLGELSLVSGEPGPFIVRFRQGGERAKPLGRDHSQTLKKLFQEYNIEPWLRPKLPLIYLGDQIISVADRIPCSEHQFGFRRD